MPKKKNKTEIEDFIERNIEGSETGLIFEETGRGREKRKRKKLSKENIETKKPETWLEKIIAIIFENAPFHILDKKQRPPQPHPGLIEQEKRLREAEQEAIDRIIEERQSFEGEE